MHPFFVDSLCITAEQKKFFLRCVIPVVLSNNKNKLNGTYVYRHKHNYIPYSMFTITKVQLHVSAINVGHFQVVHEELINKLYQHVRGVYSLWGGVGARSCFVLEKGGMDWGCFGDCVKIPFMSTYIHNTIAP